jgi:hypothetical protein
MERRRAVAIAAATATTTVAAIAAITVNFGLLGSGAAGSGPVGQLDAGRIAEVVGPAAAPDGPPAVRAVPSSPSGQHPESEHERGHDDGRDEGPEDDD